MAGVAGKSGAHPKSWRNNQLKAVEDISIRVHARLLRYVKHLDKVPDEELTTAQQQQLVTLHIKHSPDPPKINDNAALDALTLMAVEGAKELARIKASKSITIHNKILDEVEDAQVAED